MVHVAHMVLVFSSMRVYAMSSRSKLLAALVGVLSMVPVGTNAVCLQYKESFVQMMTDWFTASGFSQDSHLYAQLSHFEAAKKIWS